MLKKCLVLILALLIFVSGGTMALKLTSDAFSEGGLIPAKFTCDGQDVSPSLSWVDPPEGTKSFAIFMDDPDAPMGIWDHWVVFNIPAHAKGLPENVKNYPSGTLLGKNSWGRAQYNGPCPPDRPHRYSFRIYALNTVLDLKAGATKDEVDHAIKNHVLGIAELIGEYDQFKR